MKIQRHAKQSKDSGYSKGYHDGWSNSWGGDSYGGGGHLALWREIVQLDTELNLLKTWVHRAIYEVWDGLGLEFGTQNSLNPALFGTCLAPPFVTGCFQVKEAAVAAVVRVSLARNSMLGIFQAGVAMTKPIAVDPQNKKKQRLSKQQNVQSFWEQRVKSCFFFLITAKSQSKRKQICVALKEAMFHGTTSSESLGPMGTWQTFTSWLASGVARSSCEPPWRVIIQLIGLTMFDIVLDCLTWYLYPVCSLLEWGFCWMMCFPRASRIIPNKPRMNQEPRHKHLYFTYVLNRWRL